MESPETLENSQEFTMEFTCKSSWPIISGSLNDVVTCESSISTIDDTENTTRKMPIILRRPSPDCAPCEINILFTQQHEIKQVYVQSTARVYEIYSATNEKSENEYLCTVRCGVAARDEELQLETDGVESNSSSSNRSVDEVHSRTDSGSSTNEDGWVDVKLKKSSTDDTGDGSFSKKEESCLVQVIQDHFEATAEISDGDPVMSITLRLLSIQSGDYAYIDEVYVFADPVDSADGDCSVPSLETSSGGAMLSMLIPTLMQLSTSRTNKVQEHSAAAERSMNQDTEQLSTGSASTTNIVQTEVLPTMVHNGSLMHQPNHLVQTPNSQSRPHITDKDNGFPCSKIEQTLDELVSRVSKIEDFCLRFEENMLKPIINMESRLERVEQQLESFVKNPQIPRTGCSRFSAPDFSCNDSESNSICTGGNDFPVTQKSESKDDCSPREMCLPASDAYVLSSTSTSKPIPGLIISAPEFSFNDEEEEINSTEAVKDSPKLLKKPVSVDDALATALAGFVTSALTKPLERTDTAEEAEIVFEAEGSGSTSPPALITSMPKQLGCTEMFEEPENLSGVKESPEANPSALIHSDGQQPSTITVEGGITSSKNAMVTEKDDVDGVSVGEETSEAVDGNNQVHSKMAHRSCVDSIGETENMGCNECTESDDIDADADQTSVLDICGSPSVVDYFSREGIPEERPAVLQDIMELPSPCVVDFSAGVLDVKFSSVENLAAKSFLESLVVDMPDFCEVACARVEDTSSFNEQYDLVVIEDEEESGVCESVNDKRLYDDNYNMPSETEVQESSHCNSQGMCDSLI